LSIAFARSGRFIESGKTTVRLAKQFGFCYGVERAIDLAYAARKVFPDARLFLIGEIIHNPEVNAQIAALGIRNLLDASGRTHVEDLGPDDIVIVPAFGATVPSWRRSSDTDAASSTPPAVT